LFYVETKHEALGKSSGCFQLRCLAKEIDLHMKKGPAILNHQVLLLHLVPRRGDLFAVLVVSG